MTTGKLCAKPRPAGIGRPSQTTWIPAAFSSRVTPSTRRRYSALHDGLPSGPTVFPAGTPDMKSCASSAPNENTTTLGRSSTGARLDAREPVVEVRARETGRETALDAEHVDRAARRAAAPARAPAASESPADPDAQRMLGREDRPRVSVLPARRRASDASGAVGGGTCQMHLGVDLDPRARARSRPAARDAASSGAACGSRPRAAASRRSRAAAGSPAAGSGPACGAPPRRARAAIASPTERATKPRARQPSSFHQKRK